MIPPTLSARRSAVCIPRESGDDPDEVKQWVKEGVYSPRERG